MNIIIEDINLNWEYWFELIFTTNYLRNRNSIQIRKFSFYKLNIERKPHLIHIKRIDIKDFVIVKRFITEWKKDQARVKKEILINYVNDYIYRMLLPNDRIMKAFKVIWCQKKDGFSFDLIFVNRVRTSHHFTIKKLMFSPSPFESFLFIKEMNVNELIQSTRSFISVFINIDNSENELVSHTSQSSTPSSPTHTLQKNTSSTQLQIETPSQSNQPQPLYSNHLYLIPRNLSSDSIQYILIAEAFEKIESYKPKSYKKTIVNDPFRD